MVRAMNGLFSRIGPCWRASAASPTTPRTSCARRWPCCARSGTCCAARAGGTPTGRGQDDARPRARSTGWWRSCWRCRASDPAAAMLAKQPVAWAALVEQVMNDCLPLAERRRIRRKVRLGAGRRPPEPLPLRGDAALLTRAAAATCSTTRCATRAARAATVTLPFDKRSLRSRVSEPLGDGEQPRAARRGGFYRRRGGEIGSGLDAVDRAPYHNATAWACRFKHRRRARAARCASAP